jgi:DNA helicase-2/ATP-dependent DNA helicase PcrA
MSEVKLNKAQEKAIEDFEGTHLIIAGAGSGKTATLTKRVELMIKSGINPANILALTFTNKAARELKSRVENTIGTDAKYVTACTYHSFCALVLRQYGKYIDLDNSFGIIDNPESIILKLLKEHGYSTKGEKSLKNVPKPAVIYSYITNEIVKDIPFNEAALKDGVDEEMIAELLQIVSEFVDYKREHNLVDYTDLIVLFNQLLENNELIALTLANRYKYIMVDEFQDSNNIQCRMLKNLTCGNTKNLLVVGDDMQSIYAFNGANYRNILNFPTEFRPCNTHILEQNYRSTQSILNVANSVIANAAHKFQKNLWTDNDYGVQPILHKTSNNDTEVVDIYAQIKNWTRKGYQLGDIAILARTTGAFSLLETNLIRDKVNYQKYGGLKFLERSHIKDIMAFLKVLSNYKDEFAWSRILQLLPGLGETSAEKIAKSVSQDGYYALTAKQYQNKKYSEWMLRYQNYFTAATTNISTGQSDGFGNKNEPKRLLKDQVDMLKDYILKDLFKDVYAQDYEARMGDLLAFYDMIAGYQTATQFLEDLLLNGTPTQTIDKENCLTLSTIHSAKGLEWPCVIIMDCVEGGIPSRKTVISEDEDDIEEERRLMYVAITRAKNELVFMWPRTYQYYSSIMTGELSRFLDDRKVLNILTMEDTSKSWRYY